MYRAVDGHGRVIDVYISVRRDIAAARTLFTTAIAAHLEPEEVVTDRAAALANVIDELFIQNLRRGHYQLGVEATADHLRCAAAFDELASVI